MNATLPQTNYCQFTDLQNGIWMFQFAEASNRAVDEWYKWQSYLKETSTPRIDGRVRMLLDMRKSGVLPMLYTLQQGRDWRKKYPDLIKYRVQIALLLRQFPHYRQPYIKLIKDGVNIFTRDQVEVEVFFDDKQQATEWLFTS